MHLHIPDDMYAFITPRPFGAKPSLVQMNTVVHANASTMAVDASQLTGKYRNAGFSYPLVLCAPGDTSEHCKEVYYDFLTLYDETALQGNLLGKAQGLWIGHIRLLPLAKNSTQYSVRISTIFPRGYGANTAPFEFMPDGGPILDSALANFDFNAESGAVKGLQWLGTYPPNGEEAYFSRV